MDKRVSSVIIIILGFFFAKITFDVSFAGNKAERTPASVERISANEVPREIR